MIRDRGVAARYAQALFGAAEKRNETEAVLRDLDSLVQLEKADRSFQLFLESPSVLDEQKVLLVDRVLRDRVAPLLVQFVRLMLRKKRIQHFPLVFDRYRALVEEKLGIVRAQVVTAVPAEAELIERMRSELMRLTGKTVDLRTRVDPGILGGTVVTIGGKILDSSLRYKLEALREELLAVPLSREQA